MATSDEDFRPLFTGIVLTCASGLGGCAYRMAAPLVTQQRMRILTTSPDRLIVRVGATEHRVAPDGIVELPIAERPRYCRVYLFNKVPLSRVPDFSNQKIIEIVRGTGTLRRLSIQDMRQLKTDACGYRQIAIESTPPS